MKVLLGCDPEFFIMKDGVVVPAYLSNVTGSKETPQKLSVGAVQIDGMALEFNINPANTLEEWRYNIKTTMKEIEEMISLDCFEIAKCVTNKFSYDTMRQTPSKYKELGCNPDYHACVSEYYMRAVPDWLRQSSRHCGGHIHIGWTQDKDINDQSHILDCQLISTILCDVFNRSKTKGFSGNRRQFYGENCVIRVKPYGMEYRSPDNSWIFYDDSIDDVYNKIMKVFEYLSTHDKINITNSYDFYENILPLIVEYVNS